NVGVQLFYASLPVGLVTTADNAVSGLVIGNKSGRQLLRCHTLIDATETSLLTRLAQQEVPDPEANAIAIRTLEFDQVGTLSTTLLPGPEELGLVNERVILHQGYRGQGHLLVECWLRPGQGGPKTELDEDDITTIGRSVRDPAARRQTTRVAA